MIKKGGRKIVNYEIKNFKDFLIDGYALVNENGYILDVNSAYCKMSGFTKEELIGKNVKDYQLIDNEENIKIRIEKLKKQGYDFFESKNIKKNGEIFYCDVSINTIIYEGKICFISLIRDITEKKKLELEILKEKEKYLSIQNVIDESDSIVVIKDLNLRVIDANEMFVRLTGHSNKSELIGKTDAEIFRVSPETEPIKSYMADERMTQKLKQYDHILKEEPVIFNNKEDNIYLTKKFPIYNSYGELIATGNISSNINELKKKEKEIIIAKEEAEKANKEKSEFLSNMSHEIRTPMNGIIGFIDILLEMEEDEEKKEYLNIIKESSTNLLEIINDILSISKIEAGKFKINEEKINLYENMQSILKIYKNLSIQKNLKFVAEIDEKINREIPIIAISAYAFEENIEEMKKAGINDYISKPIKKEELISKINKWAKTKNV